MSVVFRRWRRPTVKTGGTLKTAIGVLAIERVETLTPSKISQRDAQKAGFESKAALLAALEGRPGAIYRIEVRHVGADPRLALREQDKLSATDLEEIRARLRRLDAASRTGPWTHEVLAAIRKHPKLRAADLAEHLGCEKDRLKINVRKLKNLGLTISHDPGYELSPRGRTLLEQLSRTK